MEEALLHIENGIYQEYFYISIPSSHGYRRFIYIHRDSHEQFPMYFGNELIAKMLTRPEKANWKNNLLTEIQETKLCEMFKKSFQSYDFNIIEESS